MARPARPTNAIAKTPTGIAGLDDITRGGLPQSRTTLIAGGPGSGKTVLALQALVHGAQELGESGIFVAFEESADRIVANAATFGWDQPALQRRKLFFLDAQPSPDLIHAGTADLQGLIAALDARVKAMRAQRIVFDSLDVLLSWLGDPATVRREVGRLHTWLLQTGITAIVTARTLNDDRLPTGTLEFLPFLVDCAVGLTHTIVSGVSQRDLRVLKYRGSGFAENTAPLVIGPGGIEVAGDSPVTTSVRATTARVSSGIADLDEMLTGGYHLGSSALVTGSPGTAKTTLAGAFIQAACARGERALFISFDSTPNEIVRNLASVDIRLAGHLRAGRLLIDSRSAQAASAESHLLAIRALLDAHQPAVLVIDPVSALGKQGNEETGFGVSERLIALAKSRGITILCTSLLAEVLPLSEGSRIHVSTIADTWIHLTYHVLAGERNRALTIVKSRGTAHSNQVREMVLSGRGVRLAAAYTATGEVLMGALREQREAEDRASEAQRSAQRARRAVRAQRLGVELRARIEALQQELALRTAELDLAQAADVAAEHTRTHDRQARVRSRRGRAPHAPESK